ncbi:MAG: dicarboxylate/amino acid:cation symporter [Holosporales bacterium]|nr:dicarboxylate/amino acid:cation symporter [Holosporales bacterium]
MPAVFLCTLLLAILCGNLLPDSVASFFYAVSLAIKEVLIFTLPFVVFALIYTSFSKIGVGSIKFLLFILLLICLSNFINTFISYLLGCVCVRNNLVSSIQQTAQQVVPSLIPAFSFTLPSLISNDRALLIGAIFGILSAFSKKIIREKGIHANNQKLPNNIVFRLLNKKYPCNIVLCFLDTLTGIFFKALLPIMPLFIFGTTLKLEREGIISSVLSEYFAVGGIFIISAYGYVALQLFIASNFCIERWLQYLRNLLPAIITGFGSMSSAAALPLSVKAAEANLKNKSTAAIIVPCSVNVHLVGDCFFIPLVALIVSFLFGKGLPELSTYLMFAMHFVVAKFAVAAVPGGGILVMLPILEKYLDFNGDMLGLITGLYIMFDSVITACNVAGNGAFAIIFDRLAEMFLSKEQATQS